MATTDDQTFRNQVADLLGLHPESDGRDEGSTWMLVNIRNAIHLSECLAAVERELFTTRVPSEEDDGEMVDECSVNSWGSTPEAYVEQMRKAIANKPA